MSWKKTPVEERLAAAKSRTEGKLSQADAARRLGADESTSLIKKPKDFSLGFSCVMMINFWFILSDVLQFLLLLLLQTALLPL